MTIQIGDVLWADFDIGRTRWNSQTIIGETKFSWLLGDERWPSKVNKKTLRETNGRGRGFGDLQWYTPEQMEDEKFIRSNSRLISQAVFGVRDRATLQAVADLIGLDLNEVRR